MHHWIMLNMYYLNSFYFQFKLYRCFPEFSSRYVTDSWQGEISHIHCWKNSILTFLMNWVLNCCFVCWYFKVDFLIFNVDNVYSSINVVCWKHWFISKTISFCIFPLGRWNYLSWVFMSRIKFLSIIIVCRNF